MKRHLWGYADNEGPDQTARIAQSDQGLRCPLTELVDTVGCKMFIHRRLTRPWSDGAASQAGLDLNCSRIHRRPNVSWRGLSEVHLGKTYFVTYAND